MEIIAKIINVGAVNERQYTNRLTGKVETFKSVGVWLRGLEDIYAEAVQETASKLIEAQAKNDMQDRAAIVRLVQRVRDYTDQNGVVHYTTEMRLTDWELL